MEPYHDETPIEVSIEERTASFRIANPDVDVETASLLRSALARVIGNETVDQVIIDFENVEYMGTTCLGVMVGALKRLKQSNQTLLLKNTISTNSSAIQHILEVTGLDSVFEIENSKPKDDPTQ